MKKYLFTQKGFGTFLTEDQAKKSIAGLFNWHRWLKDSLKFLGVQFMDKCEDCAVTGFTTRLKLDKSGQEYLDIDGVWKDIATP
jgi:hypothetical protein